MCSDAAPTNCASADAGATPNTQTGYISCRQSPLFQDISAWLKQINSCAKCPDLHSYSKSALDANLNLAVLHCPKCKVMHIDIPNSIANIKH